MAGKISARMVEALKLVLAGVTAYAAAQRAGVHHESLYRNALYKKYRDSAGNPAVIAEIRQDIDVTRPLPIRRKSRRIPRDDA